MDGNNWNVMKRWMCKRGHVLGVYENVWIETKIGVQPVRYRTVKLIIFRQAVDAGVDTQMLTAKQAGSLLGRMLLGFSWTCSVPGCGCIREWNPDDEALDWLKKRFDQKEGA